MRALPEEIPVTVIGLGSNLLVRDGGVEGVVVRLSARGFGKVAVEGNRIRVGAAMADKRLAAHASRPASAASPSTTAFPAASAGRSG